MFESEARSQPESYITRPGRVLTSKKNSRANTLDFFLTQYVSYKEFCLNILSLAPLHTTNDIQYNGTQYNNSKMTLRMLTLTIMTPSSMRLRLSLKTEQCFTLYNILLSITMLSVIILSVV
jgi:hypothetical protein